MPCDIDIGAALDRAARLVADKPAIGQRVYTSLAVVEEGVACKIVEKNYELTADLPRSMGGEDNGPSPTVLLRAAMSSCLAMGIKMWAARKGVPIQRIEVEVETDVDARGQFGVADEVTAGFEDVRISIGLRSAADEALLQEIVATSLRYSPLMDVFRRPQSIATKIEVRAPMEVR